MAEQDQLMTKKGGLSFVEARRVTAGVAGVVVVEIGQIASGNAAALEVRRVAVGVAVSSDLERVEEQVAEKANEAQHGAFRDGLIDDEGEEDGVNPKKGNEGLCPGVPPAPGVQSEGQQGVFDQDGHGSQDERCEQVHVDVVPHAVQLPGAELTVSKTHLIVVCENERDTMSRTFVQLQSKSKAKRRHTWDIPLTLGGWGWFQVTNEQYNPEAVEEERLPLDLSSLKTSITDRSSTEFQVTNEQYNPEAVEEERLPLDLSSLKTSKQTVLLPRGYSLVDYPDTDEEDEDFIQNCDEGNPKLRITEDVLIFRVMKVRSALRPQSLKELPSGREEPVAVRFKQISQGPMYLRQIVKKNMFQIPEKEKAQTSRLAPLIMDSGTELGQEHRAAERIMEGTLNADHVVYTVALHTLTLMMVVSCPAEADRCADLVEIVHQDVTGQGKPTRVNLNGPQFTSLMVGDINI
ncbi:hypothetical protein F7725_016134 [Dissostichus mawsoni]|uniref:Uncharacterized protein n=1 Tax=Dissostichus mawsoni TaxID=36200 RepID=A0A7J5Y3T9_DISMA|nr:hypothetical protein F7725_016134 [Dissostichus mawsoni]